MDNTIKDVSKENKKWQTDIAPLLNAGGCVSEPDDIKFRTFFRERKFVEKSNNNKMLLFSLFMEELEEPDKAMYQAKLKKQLHWQLSFQTLNGDTVMDHMYASILPYEKYATSKYYYPDGHIRKTVINKEGRGIAEKRYHSNGHLQYDIVQNTHEKKKTIIDWFKKNILEQDNGYWFNGMYYGSNSMQIMHSAKLNGKYVYQKSGKTYEAYSDKEIADAISKNFIEP